MKSHDLHPTRRKDSHVRPGYVRTIIQPTPLSPYDRHLRLDISSGSPLTVYPNRMHQAAPSSPLLVISHQSARGRSERTTGIAITFPSVIFIIIINIVIIFIIREIETI